MFEWQLPIFPFDSASVTITTTVWIGVLITAFFNLRLGWTLSALVIPGYLVPLMMARPITAVIILVESAITYVIAIWISEVNRKRDYWSSLFGRDRFFLIVIISVLVRATCDGWLLPASGQWLVENHNFDIDYKNDLNSFGLIAVALIANYFWKPGLKAGLPCLLIIVGLTWAIVTWLLVPFTNFNIGSFHLLYEDISSSMLASPKAYMIILVTGWLASWVNLRYAWDFNGILIPALVALLWTNPERIVTSFFEAGIILVIGKLLLSTNLFKNVAMQGGRKLAFFFTICFLFRLGLSHGLSQFAPDLKVTDFFGLGYLLSTLIAIKIHDRKVPVRMTKGVIQVSAVGAVLACLLGFSMDRLELLGARSAGAPLASVETATVLQTNKSVVELFKEENIRHYRNTSESGYDGISDGEIDVFRSSLIHLKQVAGDLSNPANEKMLIDAAKGLAAINYELAIVRNNEIMLRELEPFNARGWFLISPNRNRVAIVATDAVEEQWSGESAVFLHHQLDAGALAIVNAASHHDKERPAPKALMTFESVFAEIFAVDNTLFVRAQPPTSGEQNSANVFAVHSDIPASIDLPKLKDVLGDFEVRWNAPKALAGLEISEGVYTDHASATIWLSDKSRRRMVSRMTLNTDARSNTGDEEIFTRHALATWLSNIQESIQKPGSNRYVIPKEEELLFIDESILQPLFELAKESFSSSTLQTLIAINEEAKSVGYRVQVIEDMNSDSHYIALSERENPIQRRGWGTVLFKFGLQKPWGVEIPRPNFDLRSFEFGCSVFQRHGASCLLIAGAHPLTNADGSSDLTRSVNRGNLLNLARHVTFRELGDREWLMVQARSMRAPVTADIVVATVDGTPELNSLSHISRKLCDLFIADGLNIEFVDGREEVAGYELGVMLRAASSLVSDNKEVMSLWVAPDLRSKFRQQDPNDNLNAQLRACGIETVFETRSELVAATPAKEVAAAAPEVLKDQLLDFSQHHDVVKLFSTIQKFKNFRFIRFFDDQSKTTLIAVQSKDQQVVALLNPKGVSHRDAKVDKLNLQTLNEFILSRGQYLEVQP